MDQDILTTTPRRFTVAQDTIEEEFAAPFNEQVEKGDGSEEASAVSFNEEVEQEEPVFCIQEDFSTVEYGPPKEIGTCAFICISVNYSLLIDIYCN